MAAAFVDSWKLIFLIAELKLKISSSSDDEHSVLSIVLSFSLVLNRTFSFSVCVPQRGEWSMWRCGPFKRPLERFQ